MQRLLLYGGLISLTEGLGVAPPPGEHRRGKSETRKKLYRRKEKALLIINRQKGCHTGGVGEKKIGFCGAYKTQMPD